MREPRRSSFSPGRGVKASDFDPAEYDAAAGPHKDDQDAHRAVERDFASRCSGLPSDAIYRRDFIPGESSEAGQRKSMGIGRPMDRETCAKLAKWARTGRRKNKSFYTRRATDAAAWSCPRDRRDRHPRASSDGVLPGLRAGLRASSRAGMTACTTTSRTSVRRANRLRGHPQRAARSGGGLPSRANGPLELFGPCSRRSSPRH